MYRVHDNGWAPGQWILMAAMMFVFWAAVIGVIVALVRRPAAHGYSSGPAPSTPSAPHDDAERILAERFARGEIEQDEYVRRRDTLRQAK
jgi:putative membrane protein